MPSHLLAILGSQTTVDLVTVCDFVTYQVCVCVCVCVCVVCVWGGEECCHYYCGAILSSSRNDVTVEVFPTYFNLSPWQRNKKSCLKQLLWTARKDLEWNGYPSPSYLGVV